MYLGIKQLFLLLLHLLTKVLYILSIMLVV